MRDVPNSRSKTPFLRDVLVTLGLAGYLFVASGLLMVPAVLDWSIYGVALVVVLSGLLILSRPAGQRRTLLVSGLLFLLMVQAFHNLTGWPLWKELAGGLFIFVLLFVVGRLLGRVPPHKFLILFLAALTLNATVDPAQVPFWSEFAVKWESPVLYERYATADYFPLTLADLDGDGVQEIITQQNLAAAEAEQRQTAATGVSQRILEPETNYYAVYKWDGDSFTQLPPGAYSQDKLKAVLPVDYLGFPFYAVQNQTDPTQGLRQEMSPLLDRSQLAEAAVQFGRFPFTLLGLDGTSLTSRAANWPETVQPVQTPAMAEGRFLPGSPSARAVIDRGLTVRKAGSADGAVAELGPEMIPDIGIGELLAADVDRDGTDELLLTVENSRILKLTPDGTWQTLWSNPEPYNPKTRFQKFRFEDFAVLGSGSNPEIIALSKSNVRANPTRYVTGYNYQDGRLTQSWRVFTGLINLRAGDIDGDGQNELVGYLYRGHRVFVLEKHNLPVVPALYLLTGVLILWGFLKRKKTGRSRTRTLTMLLLAAGLALAGWSLQSGSRDLVKAAPPVTAAPAPEAAARLTQAFSATAEDGQKFMYSGWAVTRVEKRNIGFYASGSYDRAKGFNMDGRIFGQPFRFYRWGRDVYLSAEDKWKKASPSNLPLDPFSDWTQLRLPLETAVKLPDGDVLGKKCDVYQVTLSGSQAGEAAKSLGIETASDGLQMTLTFWVGKQENGPDGQFLYQYKAETNMPVPYAGTMYQEVNFMFWNFNDPGITIQTPDKLAPYLVK